MVTKTIVQQFLKKYILTKTYIYNLSYIIKIYNFTCYKFNGNNKLWQHESKQYKYHNLIQHNVHESLNSLEYKVTVLKCISPTITVLFNP